MKLCKSCGLKQHPFTDEKHLDCVPNFAVSKILGVRIDRDYRRDLFNYDPYYTANEILCTYLGHNKYFPSFAEWDKLQHSCGL